MSEIRSVGKNEGQAAFFSCSLNNRKQLGSSQSGLFDKIQTSNNRFFLVPEGGTTIAIPRSSFILSVTVFTRFPGSDRFTGMPPRNLKMGDSGVLNKSFPSQLMLNPKE